MAGTVTYLFEALAAAVVCAVLLVRSRKGDITRRGAMACAISVVWGLILAGQASVGVHTSWLGLMFEAVRYGAWFVLLRSLAPSPAWFKRTYLGLVVALVVYAVIGAIFGEYVGATEGLGIWMKLSQNSFRTDLVFAAILLSALVSIALYIAVGLVERVVVPWAPRGRVRT